MQITLGSQQSKVLESLAEQGGYTSLTDAIDSVAQMKVTTGAIFSDQVV